MQNLTRGKQRFANLLFAKYSSLAQEKVFSNTFGKTALSLYEDFDSAEELAAMGLEELTAYLVEKGKNRFPDPQKLLRLFLPLPEALTVFLRR